MRDKILDQIISIIDREGDMTLATVRPDGFPQANVLSYVNDGFTLYFGTSEFSSKAENIGHEEKVSISIHSPHEGWLDIESVSLGGTATAIKDPDELQYVRDLLFSKYPEIALYAPSTDEDAILFRVDPVVLTLLDYSRKFGFTQTIRV